MPEATTEYVRYLRVVGSEEYEPDNLEAILQRSYSDRGVPSTADGLRPLQTSISLYAVPATEQGGIPHIDDQHLFRLALLHAATAKLAKPNCRFVDYTDLLDISCCPQEASETPFQELSQCHHSYKLKDGDELRSLVQKACEGDCPIHEISRDDLEEYARPLHLPPLSDEWEQARAGLREVFDPLDRQRQRNFSFWIRTGLLERKQHEPPLNQPDPHSK